MANYKILVVDDEEDLCEILKFNLEVEGYDVDTANSAEEALQMNLTDYNLLLLDVMMGEMNGFKMASLLRKNEKLKHIPIIFLNCVFVMNSAPSALRLSAAVILCLSIFHSICSIV